MIHGAPVSRPHRSSKSKNSDGLTSPILFFFRLWTTLFQTKKKVPNLRHTRHFSTKFNTSTGVWWKKERKKKRQTGTEKDGGATKKVFVLL